LPANELLALDNLPCSPPSQLFDRSGLGITIYQRLRYTEDTGNVSMLEEAGRMLRLQMTNTWTPTTSVNGDASSAPDLAEERGSNAPPRHQNPHTPTPAETFKEFLERQTPFRPSAPQDAAQNGFLPTAPVPAVKARISHGDVYYMPVTLRFDGRVSNSSIAINVPGRATTTYPELLTTGAKTEAAEKPFGPLVEKDSAERARTNGDSLGVGL